MPSPPHVHPEYINFLLDPTTPLEFKINVGNEDQEDSETFGVVKWMLIARSKVLRVMLLQSDLRPKKEFTITDLDPITFRNFLVYMYGHDHTESLKFEDAIRLLNAAEKYDVGELKGRLGSVLTPKVTADNVLVILNNGPVCETLPELWAKATDVIQTKTDAVLSRPEMVTVRPEIMVHILQQDTLNVEEIQLWRASLAWAKHQLQCGEGVSPSPEDMRRTVEPLLKYIRLCTIPALDLSKEVAHTRILSAVEFQEICIAVGQRAKYTKLEKVCSEVLKRKKPMTFTLASCTSIERQFQYNTRRLSKQSQLYILNEINLSLTSVSFRPNKCPWELTPSHLTYLCQANIKISRVTNYSNNTSSEPPVEIIFNKQVCYLNERCYTSAEIPLLNQGQHIVLKAGNKYKLEITFTEDHVLYWHKDNITVNAVETKNHVLFRTIWYCKVQCGYNLGGYGSHIGRLNYKLI